MIRLLLHLLKVKDYEQCKSCEILKQQLELANAEKRELTETLLQIIKPAVVVPDQAPKELVNPANLKVTFGRKRAELEKSFRVANQIKQHSPFIAKPDGEKRGTPSEITPTSIEAMESRLGLSDLDIEGKENVG